VIHNYIEAKTKLTVRLHCVCYKNNEVVNETAGQNTGFNAPVQAVSHLNLNVTV